MSDVKSSGNNVTEYAVSKHSLETLANRIADLERHNELLRAVAEGMHESYKMLYDFANDLPDRMMVSVVSGYFFGQLDKVRAAIDGGAMEGE